MSFYEYDESRTQKYSAEDKIKIVELKRNGKSIRTIAEILDVPFGSIHRILRQFGEVSLNNSKPNLNYLSRREAEYQYEVSSKTFDYLRSKYKDEFIKIGNRVYGKIDVFDRYYYRENYDRYKEHYE